MKKEIMELNARKSAGHDKIPPKIIKVSITTLTTPLNYNVSVVESMFLKKDDNTNKENYRPISLLPSISNMKD